MGTWTPKMESELLRLREQERLAFSIIGDAIGVSRSAAIARYHRIRRKQAKVHAIKPSRKDLLVEQVRAGRALYSVANGFGMKQAEVLKVLRDRGVDYQKPDEVDYDVTPAWGWDDNARRSWIANRAAKGARKALKAMGAV